MQVPFFKIHAAYFISPELCYDDDLTKKTDFNSGYAGGHEFVCDMSNIPLEIIRIATIQAATQ
jgi:hypothetical protein